MGVWKPLSITILAASLMAGAAEAAANPRPMAGLGGQECGAWTANGGSSGASGVTLLYQQWVLGFLSGVVFTDPDHWPDGAVAEVINQSIDEFCQSNPDATIAAAAVAFVRKHQH